MIPILAFLLMQVPYGAVTGSVLDAATRRPLKGILVHLLWRTYDEFGMPQISFVHTTVTNDQGQYRFSEVLPSKDYYLATIDPQYRPVYFPNGSDISSAYPLQILPGQEVGGFDFELLPVLLVKIRGRMLDALKVRQPHLSSVTLVARYPNHPQNFPSYRVAEDGTFEIPDVPQGFYYLVGSRIDDEPNRSRSVLTVDVTGEDLEGLELIAAEGHEIHGRVRVEGPAVKTMKVVLRLVDDPARLMDVPPAVDTFGNFVIPNLPSGEYRVAVTGLPEGYYFKSARFGSIDVLESGLSVHGIMSGTLEVVVSNQGGRIEGSIVDGAARPASYSVAVLVPEVPRPERPDLYKLIQTDANGRFGLSGIAPDRYQIFGIGQFDSNSYRDPAFIRRFQDLSSHIKIASGESLTIELRKASSP